MPSIFHNIRELETSQRHEVHTENYRAGLDDGSFYFQRRRSTIRLRR